MTMSAKQRRRLDQLPMRRKIAMGEEAIALFKQMVASGQEKLTPDSVKALRELETSLVEARRGLR